MALLPGFLTTSARLEAEVWALPKAERMVPLRELWIAASQQIPPASPGIARLVLLAPAQPFILGWGQEKEKWVRAVKLAVASWAVHARGQQCACWAHPWATGGDFTHRNDENSNKQASSSQEEKGERGLLWPHRWRQVQGRQLAKESEKQRHTGGSWECGTTERR